MLGTFSLRGDSFCHADLPKIEFCHVSFLYSRDKFRYRLILDWDRRVKSQWSVTGSETCQPVTARDTFYRVQLKSMPALALDRPEITENDPLTTRYGGTES